MYCNKNRTKELALDIEAIKEVVKTAFKEVIEEMTEKEIERRLAQ